MAKGFCMDVGEQLLKSRNVILLQFITDYNVLKVSLYYFSVVTNKIKCVHFKVNRILPGLHFDFHHVAVLSSDQT